MGRKELDRTEELSSLKRRGEELQERSFARSDDPIEGKKGLTALPLPTPEE